MKLIEMNIEKIFELCRKYKVKKLFVFGSILTDRFHDESDVDLAVSFDNVSLHDYADNYFSLKNELQDVFARRVDLVEYDAISNPYFLRNLDATKQTVYG